MIDERRGITDQWPLTSYREDAGQTDDDERRAEK